MGMEACSGAHHWARLFQGYGHTVRLMAPKFVAPYRLGGKRGKNDANDAAAICEAVTRPHMRFVPVKDAHHYQHPARLTPIIARRQAGQDKAITDIAWNAQARLCARYRRLCARQLTRTKVIVAIARELVGFIWDIARRVPIKPAA